ncbi:MAG: Vps62-related protein [Reichenbachiella sp.]|uniref:Vps62-related protein n=3 Tax=Reichenbachiella sp. TaxID=2184521 RepID=UPI003267EA1B
MKSINQSKKLFQVMAILIYILTVPVVVAQEVPCGERRLFKDGTELTSIYDATYHYLETGSVSLKPGFVGKDGFSLKPSLNCSQTRPALEELATKYAPKIYHSTRENYHMSSVEWYLDRSQIGTLIEEEKWCYDCTFGTLITDEYCWDIKLTPEIQASSDCENERFTQTFYPETYWHAPLPAEYVASQLHLPYYNGTPYSLFRIDQADRAGNLDGAKAYIHIRRTHFQDAPYLNDDIEIQYHYFYPWNGDQGGGRLSAHEGDWETVRVMLDSNGEFLRIFASTHGDWNEYTYEDLAWEEGHPVIYSANESHAMYNDGGYNHPVLPVLDYCDRGPIFRTWEDGKYEIVEVSPEFKNTALEATNPSWLGFTGRWGTNPEGPVGPKTNWNVWNAQASRPGPNNSRYTIGSPLPQLISGAANVCDEETTYQITTVRPKEVTWNTQGSFTASIAANGSLTVDRNSNTGAATIAATVRVQYPGYDIDYSIPLKNIWLGSPNANVATLTFNREGQCRGKAELDFDPSFLQSLTSVDWSVTGNSITIEYGSTPYANLVGTEGGGGGHLTAKINNSCGFFDKTRFVSIPCEPVNARSLPDSLSTKEVPEPILLTDYQLYPNPTTGEVKIGLVANEKSSSFTNIRAEVFNYSGRIIENFRIEQMDGPYFDLDLSRHEKGLYLIRVFQGGVPVFESKVLKQ